MILQKNSVLEIIHIIYINSELKNDSPFQMSP